MTGPHPPAPAGAAAWRRYLPILAVAAAVAALVAGFGMFGDDDDGAGDGSDGPAPDATASLPVTYREAQAAGTTDRYDWGERCDTGRGRVAIPVGGHPDCVPLWEGDNGGGTYPGVSAGTVKVAYYVAKPDFQADTLLKMAGAYDEPEDVVTTLKDYLEIYQAMYETYGRTVELVPLRATGSGSDAAAARADAVRADEELHAFAVLGGPAVKAFADELASRGVICIGCTVSQSERFYRQAWPHVWGSGPSPEQTAAFTTEFIEKQLLGKPAEYAGDESFRDRERVFGLLTYDTPDGDFKPAWDSFKDLLRAAGVDLEAHVSYYLDLATAQEDSRTIVTKLKNAGVTTVIFSGDPIMPAYFTKEATAQAFFPEWVMAGTVFADTNVFGRTFDQEQWSHAFGLSLIPVRTPPDEGAAVRLHEWWFGTEPPAENSNAIVLANVMGLMNGIQLAGPDLTPDTFAAGITRLEPRPPGPLGLDTIVTYGSHGIWPGDGYLDVNGLDNATIVWWDPAAEGEDETGAAGAGMYRYIDGGRRYLPGDWPTEPMQLFEAGDAAVTVYETTPEELRAPRYPPPDATRAG